MIRTHHRCTSAAAAYYKSVWLSINWFVSPRAIYISLCSCTRKTVVLAGEHQCARSGRVLYIVIIFKPVLQRLVKIAYIIKKHLVYS